jgi:tight adherence protein B
MIVAALAALGGIALMVFAGLSHRRALERVMDDLLGMAPAGPEREQDEDLGAFTARAVDLAGQAVERVDRDRTLTRALERAKVPLRPGEFVIILAGGALGVAALLLFLTHSLPAALGGAAATVLLTAGVLRRRTTRRRRAFEAQLPDALGLVASSLSAGHTFLRAIQTMCEESGPPLSEEFSRVVAEARLGDPVVVALDRMAARLQIRDMDMVVQAIRIQQTIGGRLAELLHTLAEFIRARDEVRREIKVLTAEGRMSAYVLAGLVPFLFAVIRILNPPYLEPLYRGWGLVVLLGCGASVLIGLLVILRMVTIEF